MKFYFGQPQMTRNFAAEITTGKFFCKKIRGEIELIELIEDSALCAFVKLLQKLTSSIVNNYVMLYNLIVNNIHKIRLSYSQKLANPC